MAISSEFAEKILQQPVEYDEQDDEIDDPRAAIYDLLNEIPAANDHWIIAGGYALMLYDKKWWDCSDMDFFFYDITYQLFKEIADELYTKLSCNNIIQTIKMIKIYDVYRIIIDRCFSIDLVATAHSTATEVLESFDLDCVRIGFRHIGGEYRFIWTPPFMRAFESRAFTVSDEIVRERSIAKRVEKYRSRGFDIEICNIQSDIDCIIERLEELKTTQPNDREFMMTDIYDCLIKLDRVLNNSYFRLKRQRFLHSRYWGAGTLATLSTPVREPPGPKDAKPPPIIGALPSSPRLATP